MKSLDSVIRNFAANVLLPSAALVLLCAAATAQPATVTIVSNAVDFRQSTTVEPNSGGFWTGASSLPASGTFTLVPVPGALHVDNVTGSTNIFSANNVRFYRGTFALAPFSSLTVDLQASFDNDLNVFFNGNELALEGSLAGSNFGGGIHHRVFVASDGSVTNGFSGGDVFDSVAASFPSTNFGAGTNDVILAVRNLGGGDTGGFSFRADIVTTAIPEPSTYLLMLAGLGMVGWVVRRHSRASASV